jgi:hypothetical protein
MKTTRLAVLIVAGAVALTSGPILADQDVRHVPERDIPVRCDTSRSTATSRSESGADRDWWGEGICCHPRIHS